MCAAKPSAKKCSAALHMAQHGHIIHGLYKSILLPVPMQSCTLESQSICSDVLLYLVHISSSVLLGFLVHYVMDVHTEISIDYTLCVGLT